VERVQGTCDPRNLASAAVLRRAGLFYEGTLRHTVHLRDGWRDSTMHSILRHEWTAISGE
jgi:ribosomal-protein-alanine N-acetyltransferase